RARNGSRPAGQDLWRRGCRGVAGAQGNRGPTSSSLQDVRFPAFRNPKRNLRVGRSHARRNNLWVRRTGLLQSIPDQFRTQPDLGSLESGQESTHHRTFKMGNPICAQDGTGQASISPSIQGEKVPTTTPLRNHHLVGTTLEERWTIVVVER